jgi:hypothetical protein
VATFSPLHSLFSAEGIRIFGKNNYWSSLAAVMGVSWTWLVIATWRVSRSWRDQPKGVREWGLAKILEDWRERGRAGRVALRRRLLGINPFFWLGARGRITSPVFMCLAVLVTIITSYVAAPFFATVMPAGVWKPMVGHLFAWFWGGAAIHALLFYYAAMIASRRLAEDKQTGALELVLSTPTSEASISRGLWMAYGRRMLFPATVAILVYFFFIWQCATMAVLDPPSAHIPPGTTAGQLLWHVLLGRPFGGVRLDWGFTLVLRIALSVFLLFILVWFTLGWLARWLGLRMKHAGFAPMASLALVFIPPVILFSFLVYLVNALKLDRMPDRQLVPLMVWIALGIGVSHCVLLSRWAARRLRKDFRAIATGRFQPASVRTQWLNGRVLWRIAARTALIAALLVTAGLSFYGYQNWRSRRDWSAFQNGLKRRGESLDVSALLSGPVPENQNLARSPAFRRWLNAQGTDPAIARLWDKLKQLERANPGFADGSAANDWSQQMFAPLAEILEWLAPTAGQLSETNRDQAANAFLQSLRAYDEAMRAVADAARLPHFQTFTNRNSSAVLRPAKNENLVLERLHLLFGLRASAFLSVGQSSDASDDLLTTLQLVRLARQIPDARATTRAQTMLLRSLQPLWEGIVEHRWSEEQLTKFQEELSQFNLLADYTNAVRRAVLAQIELWQAIPNAQPSRATNLSLPQPVWHLQPRAWWFDHCSRLYEAGEVVVGNVNASEGRVQSEWVDLSNLPLDHDTTALLQQGFWWSDTPGSVVFAQTALNQAILACALERYRLINRQYPEKLDELRSNYLPTIPNDVARGSPMLYENSGDGRFILHGVGQNQKIDRNQPASDDWLWSFPTNALPLVNTNSPTR